MGWTDVTPKGGSNYFMIPLRGAVRGFVSKATHSAFCTTKPKMTSTLLIIFVTPPSRLRCIKSKIQNKQSNVKKFLFFVQSTPI